MTNTSIDSLGSLSVGNGRFAFTADITGLQTFPEFYEKGIPLGTMTEWGWHSFPNPENYTLDDVVRYYKVGEDSVPYWYQFTNDPNSRRNRATQWLRENPHRLHLGLIGLEMYRADSDLITIHDIEHPKQELDLWTGELTSEFSIDRIPVRIKTFSDQLQDRIGVKIESELIETGRLSVSLYFPYACHEKFSPGYDLDSPDKHTTLPIDSGQHFMIFQRKLDETIYYARIDWKGKATVKKVKDHRYLLKPGDRRNELEFTVLFSESLPANHAVSFSRIRCQNRKVWKDFWQSGGAVDFSACTDPRAEELERKIVLSQYLTKIQCTGSLPPQETGLTYNSWHGKFHLEMHWWHLLHFILWKRPELMEDQLDYYSHIYKVAEETAVLQGYRGIRWPKMTNETGRESPSSVGVFLIWQQPHIIYFADLLYRYYGEDPAVLAKYSKLVSTTADFMASYARYDSIRKEYILGPALIPAQERFDPEVTINPAFELAYWHWGLETAQRWRERMGLKREDIWQQVIDNLAPIPVKDSLYLFTETAGDSWTNEEYLGDHPMVLGCLGLLPETEVINRRIMENTRKSVMKKWNWESCWGWDFPLAAMNATLLDQPEKALDLLLMDTPKNRFLANGQNYQDENLTIYLPGNGGLLTAVALMCTYRNERGGNGFPAEGGWKVRYENIYPLWE